MTDEGKKISRGMAVGSVGIICSRIAGLARDMIFSRFWGTGDSLGAFILAFTIPNLFRRFFGEGALSEAFVPLFNERLERQGKAGAFLFLSQILSVLLIVLTSLCAIGIGLTFLARPLFPQPMAALALKILPVLLPYLIFICLAGFLAGVLNSFEHFAVPSFAPMILNVSLVSATLVLCPRLKQMQIEAAYGLALAVVAAGILQLLVLIPVLGRFGFHFRFKPAFRSESVRELTMLILPGMAAAGIYQVNVLCDRLIAAWLGPEAVTSLYYSERLVYLPIGVFAVALTAAVLPVMSRAFAAGRHDDMNDALLYAARHILFLSLPCVLGLTILGRQAIALLYQGGRFDEESLRLTLGALLFYAPGIPAFAAVKIVRSVFFSQKDTRTPMKVSLFCLFLNITLNICLMIPLQQRGIALATSISSFANCGILLFLLHRKLVFGRDRILRFLVAMTKLLAVLVVTGLVMYFARIEVALSRPLLRHALELAIPGAAGAATYLVAAFCLRCTELRELLSILRRRR